MRRLLTQFALTIAGAFCLLGTGQVFPLGGNSASEYQIKAAFLYNFIKYVDWPTEALPNDGRIVVGILGESPMDLALKSLDADQVKDRKLVIKRLKNPAESHSCQLLFLGASERKRLKEILDSTKGSSALTISEVPGFTEMGGMINFLILQDEVHFEINLEAAQQAKLRISSKLLRLATTVVEKKSQERK